MFKPLTTVTYRKLVKRVLFVSLFIIITGMSMIWMGHSKAEESSMGKLYNNVEDIPESFSKGSVGLVLGCSKYRGGSENLFFKYRISAAAELWKSGKIRGLVVSGDNSSGDYNEPEDMKQSLIDLGVPADKIVCDYGGLRTLDSLVRLKEVFGEQKAVLISQKFHNERSCFIAKNIGIDVIGLNAKSVNEKMRKSVTRREYFARAKMILDSLVGTEAKYLGKKEPLTF